MKTATETSLVRACLDYLALMGIPSWRNNTGAVVSEYKGRKRFTRYGKLGSSDILGVLPPHGRLLAIEAKMPDKYPSEAQRTFLANVQAAGGLAVVVRDLNDLIDALDSARGDT